MARLRRTLRAWRRALSWAVVESSGDPGMLRLRVRTRHPLFWLAVARELWRTTRLTFHLWRWSLSIGGGSRAPLDERGGR